MSNEVDISMLDSLILAFLYAKGCDTAVKSLSVYDIEEYLITQNYTTTARNIRKRITKLEGIGVVKQGYNNKRKKRFYITNLGKSILKIS